MSSTISLYLDQSANFGELRSLLQREPGPAVWRDLVEFLDDWWNQSPSHFDGAVVPYVLEHLKRWPDRERWLPGAWLERMLEGKRHPEWWGLIARAVRVDDLSTRAEAKKVVRGLASGSFLRNVTVLELPGSYMRSMALWGLVRSPHLGALRELDLSYNGLGYLGIHALLRADAFEKLERLVLDGNGLGGKELEALMVKRDWPALEHLSLANNRIDVSGVWALIQSSMSRHLTSLALGKNALGDDGVCALAVSPLNQRLAQLDVSRNELTWRGGLALSKLAVRLRRLDVSHNPLGDRGVIGLTKSGRCFELERLNLSNVSAGPDALAHLDAYNMPALEELDLSGNALGEAGVYTLVCARDGAQLRALDLSGTGLNARAVRTLIGAESMGALERLSLSFNDLGDAGDDELVARDVMRSLVSLRLDHCGLRSSWRPRFEEGALEELTLRSNPVGDAFVAHLVRSPWARTLRSLDLARCGITDVGARLLASSPALSNLESLDLSENAITDQGARALIEDGLPSLSELRLKQCQFGDSFARQVARSQRASRLTRLDVSWAVDLSPHGVAAMRASHWLADCEVIAGVAPRRG